MDESHKPAAGVRFHRPSKPPSPLARIAGSVLRCCWRALIPPDRPVRLQDDPPEMSEDNLQINRLAERFSSELFAQLLLELPGYRRIMTEAYKTDNHASLRDSIHQLLGGVAYCDAPELESDLRELQLALKTGHRETVDLYFIRAIDSIDNTLRCSGTPG